MLAGVAARELAVTTTNRATTRIRAILEIVIGGMYSSFGTLRKDTLSWSGFYKHDPVASEMVIYRQHFFRYRQLARHHSLIYVVSPLHQ
jgi:hypothetical protein